MTVREPKARHGRREQRSLWVLADPELNGYVGSSGEHGLPWPHLAQVCRLERRRTLLRAGRVIGQQAEVSYAITSRPPEQAGAAELLQTLRGHWGIENKIHWVRDVTFDEDRCQVRSGAAPQALAACRTLAIALIRRRDGAAAPIASALRTHAGRPASAVQLALSGGR